MEIRQLKYFIAAAEQLNFTRAAQKCNIVQTAMTQQIANLEQELKVKLFERTHRALTLTVAGERFLHTAKKIVSSADLAAKEISDFQQGYENIIRIGYHGEMFKTDLTQIMKRFRGKYPSTKVYLRQEPQDELVESLETGEIDLAFTIYGSFFEELDWMRAEILDENRLKLVLAKEHPLAHKERICWEDLQQELFVDFEEANRRERQLGFLQNGIILNYYSEIQDHTSGEILIESGYGVALWTARMCTEQDYPNLCFRDVDGYPDRVKTSVIYRKNDLNSQSTLFMEEMWKYEKERGR